MVINSNIFGGGTKEKNKDENCEYEMVWDAEGSMHLIKKIVENKSQRPSDRSFAERCFCLTYSLLLILVKRNILYTISLVLVAHFGY